MIIILTAATIIIGVYTVVVQFDLFGKKASNDVTVIPQVQTQAVSAEEVAQDVKKESKHLTIQQLESVVDARNPFEVAPVVEKQYQSQEKEYQELVAKIEKRITELEEEKAKQEAAQNGTEYVPSEQSFEEKVQEEIQKIIQESRQT